MRPPTCCRVTSTKLDFPMLQGWNCFHLSLCSEASVEHLQKKFCCISTSLPTWQEADKRTLSLYGGTFESYCQPVVLPTCGRFLSSVLPNSAIMISFHLYFLMQFFLAWVALCARAVMHEVVGEQSTCGLSLLACHLSGPPLKTLLESEGGIWAWPPVLVFCSRVPECILKK